MATLGAAYLSGWGLMACYIFGAPRVGDRGFASSLRIPVYRVVNPLDPVPLVPGRWRGYRDLGDEERLKRTCALDTLREIGSGLFRLCRSEWGRLPSSHRFYDKIDQWHNIRVYREKLRDDAGSSV